ncbi:hypothetical protein RUM43_008614 [Polyplax serrata]|uniref:Ig-like domain-containing protein n=1 Tax=Polyplax serrata TaxID=468196 RepID=A0AAN8S0M7_POLSC
MSTSDKPRFPYLLVDGRRLDTGNNFLPVKESLDLMLTCLVEGGNPRPTIKWMVILSSNLDPVLLDESGAELGLNVTETRGSDVTANRVSSLELTRSEARIASIQRIHHKATVVCIVDHPALKSPLNASILLDVQCK